MPYSPSGSSFPGSKTTFVDPSALTGVDTFDHAGLESAQNDAIEKLEDAVGTTASGDTASLNYKVTNASSIDPGHLHTSSAISGTLDVPHGGTGAATLTGVLIGNGTSPVTTVTAPSGAIVGTTDTQTLTGKTITTPTLTLKQSTAPTPTAEGDIQWDTDDNKIKVGDGATTKTFSDDSYTLSRTNHTGTQTASTISDMNETVEDIIGTKIIAGTNVTVSYNDTNGETTIASTGGGGGVTDGDKGDVTVSGTGTVWTVDNDAITYAKMQNVSATDKVLGRSTSGAGDVEEIPMTAAGRALIDDVDAAAQRTTLGLDAGAAGDIWVEKAGDTSTGTQNITVATATSRALVLKTSDDSATNPIMEAISSANAALMKVDKDGSVYSKISLYSDRGFKCGTGAYTGTSILSGYISGIDAYTNAVLFGLKANASQSQPMMNILTSAGAVLIQFGRLGDAIFNEQGNDADFRIEGDTEPNLLFTDASTDRIGVGTATPSQRVEVYSITTADVGIYQQSADLSGATLYLSKRGTTGDNTAFPANGSSLGGVVFRGWSNANLQTGASITTTTNETWSNTARGTNIDFSVRNTGTTTNNTVLRLSGAAVTVLGSLGNTVFSTAGNEITMTRNSANYIYASNASGALNLGSGGVNNGFTMNSGVVANTMNMTATGVGIKQTAPNSRLQVTGSYAYNIRAITANRTLTVDDATVFCDTSAGGFTVTLPTSVGIDGREYTVTKTSALNSVTIATTSSQTINGTTPLPQVFTGSVTYISDGANWWVKNRENTDVPVPLVDGATIATNAALGKSFTVVLGGNRTLGNPTNAAHGQKITYRIKQDSTGSRTLTLDTDFRLGSDITSTTLSTGSNKVDYLGAIYDSVDAKWDVVAFTKGY